MTERIMEGKEEKKEKTLLYPRYHLSKLSHLVTCLVELTNECPFSCIHCDITKVYREKENVLSKHELTQLFYTLRKLGVFKVVLTGGEPFAREDILPIIQEAIKNGLSVLLLTNGWLVTDVQVRQLALLPRLQVSVSLHGFAEEHDAITGVPGSFERAINAIRMFKKHGVTTRTMTSVMRMNYPCLDAFTKWLTEKEYLDYRLDPKILGDDTIRSLRLTDSELVQFYVRHSILPRLFLKWKYFGENVFLPDIPNCSAGRTLISVSATGKVMPCLSLRTVLGDIRRTQLQDIWSSSELLLALRTRLNNERWECANCSSLGICSSCPADAWQETGSWLSKPTECCRHLAAIERASETIRLPEVNEMCRR